ncbi:conserved hypothetical protein [Desulfosarcina cetonica]|nr:conserved hypothetical protein [Desulfosarcina cetonica]
MGRRYPVQGGLHLAAVRRITAAGGRIISAAQFDHLAAIRILDRLPAGDEVGVAQPYFPAGCQPEEFLGRIFHEVVAFDVKLAGEGELADTGTGILGIVDRLQFLGLVFGIVFDDHFEGLQDAHHPGGAQVEILTDAVLEKGHVHHAVAFGQADAIAEVANRLGGEAPSPQATDGGHARIVPAAHMAFRDELDQLALAQHGVVQVQAGEFDLLGMAGRRDVVQHPVIERPVVFELQGAQAVGDALQAVRQAMGEIIHGVNAPDVAGAVVTGLADAVEGRVAHDQIRVGHVDLGAQDVGAVVEFAGAHALEEIQVLFDRAVAPGAVLARFGQRAAMVTDLVGAQIVHISLAGTDQLDGEFIEPFEIIRCIVKPRIPVKAQPVDILHDGVHIFHVFLGGVGVVEAQVASPMIGLGHAEVQADRFGMADVQVSVGFGRKSGGHPSVVFMGFQIRFDNGLDKMASR